VVLVGLSLAMSGWLLMGVPGTAPSSDQPFTLEVAEKPNVDMQSVLGPSRIVLHFGENRHTVVLRGSADYRTLWGGGLLQRAALGRVSGPPREVPVNIKAIRSEAGGIELLYPVKVPVSYLVRLWTGYAWTGGQDFLTDRVVLSVAGDPAAFAYSCDHEKFFRLDVTPVPKEAAELASHLKYMSGGSHPRWVQAPAEINGVAVAEGILLPQSGYAVPALEVRGEQTDPDAIVQKFFLDRSVVRRIDERDGAVIYMGGQQGLRIYPPGAIDYRCLLEPEKAPLLDYPTALEKALEFVAGHGGLPEGIHPADLAGRGRGMGLQEVRLSYCWRGYPVWGAEAPIVVGLSSQGVGLYVRNVRVVLAPVNLSRPMMSPEKALDILSRHWATVFPEGVKRSVKDIQIGYWSLPAGETQDVMKPVWVIESESGLKGFVDAESGAVWGEERTGP
jgi:hypothetical protein